MGRARESVKKAPQPSESPQKHRKRAPLGPPSKSLKAIEQLKEARKATRLKAANTRRNYAGHVKRGRTWLAQFFKDGSSSESKELSWLTPDHVVGKDDPYTNPAFECAFDRTPNEFSDRALSLFLTYKGFHENPGKNTVDGIRAAFKDLWDGACVPEYDHGNY